MAISKIQAKLRASILNMIYAHAPISRVDISKKTGITPATTSTITGELIQEGFIYELGEENSSENKVGRKKILLDIKPDHLYYIGSEISGNYYSYVVADNLGNLLEKETVAVDSHIIKENGVQLFIQHLNNFIVQYQHYGIQAIGITIPGRYLHNYLITTNNPLWENFDLKTIQQSVDYPVFFSNNVNAMAMAKRLFSSERKDENFIFFHLGRGMHCSYIYNGKIYGRDNISVGEIGHTVISSQGELCECGRRGCLQTYASTEWLVKKARLFYHHSPSTYLKSLVSNEKDITATTLLTAYDLGDVGVCSLLDAAISALAQAILNLNMVIDADKIYLHSPLLKNQQLADLLKQQVLYEPKLFLLNPPKLTIESYTKFTGALAGVALALYQQKLVVD